MSEFQGLRARVAIATHRMGAEVRESLDLDLVHGIRLDEDLGVALEHEDRGELRWPGVVPAERAEALVDIVGRRMSNRRRRGVATRRPEGSRVTQARSRKVSPGSSVSARVTRWGVAPAAQRVASELAREKWGGIVV